ncbi:MAG: ribonuclease Z [Bacteroidaceae bacterium]|nr:ribonuclease Z [Bacteroidaceae bacterium]
MEKFEVHILGCGSALPTTRHFPTSQVVNIREKLFMIDCGEGAQMQLRRSRLKFSRLSHIFISHLHGDHCFGLIGLISTFALLGRTATLHIYAHPELERLMRPWLDFFCHGIDFDVEFHAIDTQKAEVIYEDRSVTVSTIPLKHRVPCCGFLFAEKRTPDHIIREMVDFYQVPVYELNRIKNGGDYITPEGELIPHNRLTTPSEPPCRYAYCSDTTYLPENIPLLQGVDLLFHEATFGNDNEARARETYHTTARQAATLARETQAKQLLIGHFSARYEDESILLKEAKEIFPHTLLAKENMCINIKNIPTD